MRGTRTPTLSAAAFVIAAAFTTVSAEELVPYAVAGDGVALPLAMHIGEAARGRVIVFSRQLGNCLICHTVPNEPNELAQGNVGPALGGVGTRLNEGQIRLRLIDQSRFNQRTIMPPYYRTEGLTRVAAQYSGKPVLDAQQIEDVVSYLAALKD